MTSPAGLLTRDISRFASEGKLPHRDLSARVKRAIVLALCDAWLEIREEVAGDLATSKETDLTAALEHYLNRILEDQDHPSGFRGTLFTVVREASVATYDGSSLQKEPDLIIRLHAHRMLLFSEYKALFVECKPVDRSHPVSRYCNQGLVRFVRGDYAWAMPSGMMIAFVRGGRSVSRSLRVHLKRHLGADDPYRTVSMPRRAVALPGSTYVTEHDRLWVYPETQCSPGRIVLIHLWLTAD